MIGDSAHQLLAVHLRACQAAPPDPVTLADYLAGLLLNDGYGFAPDLAEYACLLGDTGQVRQHVRTNRNTYRGHHVRHISRPRRDHYPARP
jgi:hypothetical protein